MKPHTSLRKRLSAQSRRHAVRNTVNSVESGELYLEVMRAFDPHAGMHSRVMLFRYKVVT